MARIIGVEVPPNKRIDIALRYVYGIGPTNANQILAAAKIDPSTRAKDLTETQLSQIVHAIQDGKYVIEGDLRREIGLNLKRLQAIKCYRGIRHLRGLPVRGQRTSTNARTRKGPRKTVGVQRNPNGKTGSHYVDLWLAKQNRKNPRRKKLRRRRKRRRSRKRPKRVTRL